jgi:selenocysteine lyase/cysteine desulfurase
VGDLPKDFFEDSEKARALFAQLAGEADGVTIIPSVSYRMVVAAASMPVEEGHWILLEDQFPSNVCPWHELAKHTRVRLITVPRRADHDWTGAVLEYLDERIALVAVPNRH